jgi:alpha-D-ribose 1-methylphosphonate 5-triphosphate synthase subunit PhnL
MYCVLLLILKIVKEIMNRHLVQSPIGKATINDEKVVKYRDTLYATIGKVKARLRSLSPSKFSGREQTTEG